MVSIAFLIYLAITGVQGGMMGALGYGIDTWQYWIVLICSITAYICGREYERTRK